MACTAVFHKKEVICKCRTEHVCMHTNTPTQARTTVEAPMVNPGFLVELTVTAAMP